MATFGPYTATVDGIHDGDTLTVDVLLAPVGKLNAVSDRDLGFHVHRTHQGIVIERQSVRLFGCNAPELATPAGKAALAYIETLVKVGDQVKLLSHGVDKYGGRIDGAVTLADGRDLSKAMIAAGHAVFWDGTGVKPVPVTATN